MAQTQVCPSCLAWVPGGFAIGTDAGVVVWTVGGVEYVSASGQSPLTCVALSYDATHVLAAGHGTRATLHKQSDGKSVKLVSKRMGGAGVVSLTADGTRALHGRASFGADGARLDGTFGYHAGFCRDDTHVASVEDNTLTVSDLLGQTLKTHSIPARATCFASSRSDTCAVGLDAVIGENGDMDVGKLAIIGKDEPRYVQVFDEYEPNSVAVSPDGMRVAVGGYVQSEGPVGGVRVICGDTVEPFTLPFAPPVSRNGLAFSPSGALLAAIVPGDKVRITDLSDGSRFWEIWVSERGRAWCLSSHDGRVDGAGIEDVDGTAEAGLATKVLLGL